MQYVLVTETAPSKAMSYTLWALVEQQGILREDCTLLQLLGTEKPEGSYQRSTSSQLSRVLPAFRKAVAQSEGQVIIPMGGPAFKALTGLGWNIANSVGYVIEPLDCRPIPIKAQVQVGEYKTTSKAKGYKVGDPRYADRVVPHDSVFPRGCRWIVPGVPVETVIKQRYKTITQFRAAFINARRLVEGEERDDARFDFTDGVPEPGLDWSGVVAYDLEVPIGSTAIERASLSSAKGVWSFGWSGDAVRAFKEAMEGASVRVAHNQQFDIPILKHHGIEVPEPTFDTMLGASLLEPDLPKGLAAVAPLHLLLHPWKHLSETKGFADPFYNAKDSFVERRLAIALRAKLDEYGMLDLFTTRIMPSVPVLMDMREQGIKVDVKAADKWCTQLQIDLDVVMAEWVTKYPGVSPTSPHQIKHLLYQTWGLPIQRKKGDGITTDELALRTLAKLAPSRSGDLALLLQIREIGKSLGTFGKGLLGIDRVHPSYLPVGKDAGEGQYGKGLAATGRLACSNPNIQQQPKEVRHVYIPDEPDMYFVELDWSQAELRVAAAMADDKAMLKALEGDIHSVTQVALGCDRTRAKNVVYGSAYGAGPKKLREVLAAAGVAVSTAECSELQERLAKLYPKWWAWRNRVATEAAERKYLRNPFGRVRRFPLGEQDTPAALDFLPQSVIADMAWSLYRPMWEEAKRLGGRLTTVVHDSFLVQLPVGVGFGTIKGLLEREFPEVVPGFWVPVEAKVGRHSWGDLVKEGA